MADEVGGNNEQVNVGDHKDPRLRENESDVWGAKVNRSIASLTDALAAPTSSIKDIANLTLKSACSLTESPHGYVAAIEPETGDQVAYTLTAMMGKECFVKDVDIRFPRGKDGRYGGLWGHALNTGEAFYTNTPQTHPASTGLPRGHVPLHSFLAAPAVVGAEVVGQIALANSREGYGERELDALRRMAQLFGLAVKHKRTEEALKEAEAKYRSLVEESLVGICIIQNGRVAYSNPRFAQMLGYTQEEVVSVESVLDLVSPEDRSLVAENLRRRLTGEQLAEPYAIHGIRKDDAVVDIEAYGTGINYEGRPAVLESALDITERKRAEEALRDSEERFRLVLEGSQLGFWDWNIETGEVRRNARWAEMLGYTLEEIELTVNQWTDLIHPDDRAAAWDSINEHLENRAPQYRTEYRMRAKDGEYKWILDQAAITVRDPQGKPLRMSGTHTDITDRKRAEEALRRREEEFRTLAENSPDLMLRVDKETRTLYVNPVFERVTGVPRGELIGIPVRGWPMPVEFASGIHEACQHAAQTGRAETLEFWYPTPDEARRYQTLFIPEFDTDGKPESILIVGHDITEHKRVEEALEYAYYHERRIAEALQRALIPEVTVELPDYEIVGAYQPALQEEEVGGDFYDVFSLPDGYIAVVMGDVAGKGLEAAVYTAMCRNMLRGFVSEAPWPAITLQRMDNALKDALPDGEFITLAYALLDPGTGTIRYASGGHEPALIYRADEGSATTVNVLGHALGSGVEGEFKELALVLGEGDLILLYTDGIVDAGRPDNYYGLEGMMEALRRNSRRSAKQLLAYVMAEAIEREWGRRSDDKAVLALKRLAQP